MATYTTQLKTIVESETPLFDFDYPIFDDEYRPVLENKIINAYYFSEIGLETVEKFKHYLKTRLQIIMPYYNQLYETEGLVDKDNYNINLDNEITRTNKVKTDSEGSSDGQNNDKTIFSDTPQSSVNNSDYATNITDGNGSSKIKSNSKLNTIEEYQEHLLGNGSMRYNADILMEWRESFLNIDQQIIDELQDLFMTIY